jgi:tetratricopeptide (TPR) repeat protein
MTIVNGFITLLILLLLAYSLYRSIKRKSLLMLIPVCMQVFAAMISIMSFAGDVEALLEVEAVYILFGIVPPSALLIYDYRKMIGGFKAKGGFEGLVKGVPRERPFSSFPPEGINSIKKRKQLSEITEDLGFMPEDLRTNFRKCLVQAHTSLNKGESESAAGIYKTLSRAAGSSYALYYNYGCLCYDRAMYEEAKDAFQKSLQLFDGKDDERAAIYYNLGNTLFMLEKFERAAGFYEKSLGICPGDAEVLENLSYAYVRLGEADKGIEVMKKISSDKSYRPHYVWGRLLAEAGKLDEAEAELEKACKLRADSTEAREELARVLMKQNKADEAIVIFNEILQLDPDNYLAWHNKANALAKKVLWKEAASAYREAVRLKPDFYRSWYNMALALDESGDRKAAIKAYIKTVELSPDFAEAYNNLGIALSLEGMREQALKVYQEGIEKDPHDYSLFFNMGICLMEEKRYMEAAGAFRNALDLNPNELEIYYYLGAVLTEMRHYNDAIDAYKSALKIKPADGELQYNLAAVYAMLGRYDIAFENLKSAIDADRSLSEDLKVNSAFDGMRGRSDFKELVS